MSLLLPLRTGLASRLLAGVGVARGHAPRARTGPCWTKASPLCPHSAVPRRQLCVTTPLAERLVSFQKTKGLSAVKSRGDLYDESDKDTINLDALAEAKQTETDPVDDFRFSPFPDEETAGRLFNGIRYDQLPYVTINCGPNNTKFWANYAQGNHFLYRSPRMCGFLNAKKRTNVAAQVTALSLGQSLRGKNVRTVRVRIKGFNNGRVSSLKGLVQAGIQIVSVTDITVVDWGWCQRAKKRKRRN